MDHLVMIKLHLKDGWFGSPAEHQAIFAFQDRLEKAVTADKIGFLDGDEFGNFECVIYLYGHDADRVFSVVRPLLVSEPLAAGGSAIIQYGEPDDPRTQQVTVTW